MRDEVLALRLQPFLDQGLIPRLPTRWQRLQGQVEMAGYVVAPDSGDAERYAGTPLGNPVLRQPLTAWYVGHSHFRIGNGLGAPAEALFRHLAFVYHEGMPSYDLQLIQTHEAGLERLRQFFQQIEDGATPEAARLARHTALVIPEPGAYRARFLGPGGFIERAAAFDYAVAEGASDDTTFRPEFMTLVRFLNHCARAYPERLGDRPWRSVPGHLAHLATARFRPTLPESAA